MDRASRARQMERLHKRQPRNGFEKSVGAGNGQLGESGEDARTALFQMCAGETARRSLKAGAVSDYGAERWKLAV